MKKELCHTRCFLENLQRAVLGYVGQFAELYATAIGNNCLHWNLFLLSHIHTQTQKHTHKKHFYVSTERGFLWNWLKIVLGNVPKLTLKKKDHRVQILQMPLSTPIKLLAFIWTTVSCWDFLLLLYESMCHLKRREEVHQKPHGLSVILPFPALGFLLTQLSSYPHVCLLHAVSCTWGL